jgi:hypothetical protein
MEVNLESSPRIEQAFRDLQEMLCEVIDEGYFVMRNPPEVPSLREQMLLKRQGRASEGESGS